MASSTKSWIVCQKFELSKREQPFGFAERLLRKTLRKKPMAFRRMPHPILGF